MPKYESFQWNWILIIGMSIVVLFLSVKLNDSNGDPIPFFVAMMLQLLLILIPLMFYGLRTIINDDEITLKYGIGIIKIRLSLTNIKSVEVVRNRWYYGIGIRLIPHGMLYNVHGLDAVEIRFKNKKSIVRIGTGEPEILKYEIEKRLNSYKVSSN